MHVDDDPFWVGQNSGQSSPDMITTTNGQLVFTLSTTASGEYVSGILDTTVPFCLGRGFIVVGMQLANGGEAQLFVRSLPPPV
jgi:hypothetical protein